MGRHSDDYSDGSTPTFLETKEFKKYCDDVKAAIVIAQSASVGDIKRILLDKELPDQTQNALDALTALGVVKSTPRLCNSLTRYSISEPLAVTLRHWNNGPREHKHTPYPTALLDDGRTQTF